MSKKQKHQYSYKDLNKSLLLTKQKRIIIKISGVICIIAGITLITIGLIGITFLYSLPNWGIWGFWFIMSGTFIFAAGLAILFPDKDWSRIARLSRAFSA